MSAPVVSLQQSRLAGRAESRPERRASRSTSPTILVVDDDPHVRAMLRLALELEGYEVDEAPDGYRALRRLERTRPDLLLLDLMLPGLDGFGVVRALRERGLHGEIPVILMSASGLTEQAVAGAGAAAYLSKPFDVRRLLTEVERQVNR